MFTRKSKPVEDRVHRVVEATGRAPELRQEGEPPGDSFRAAPGPIPPRRIVEPEPEPLYPAPGRDAAPIEQVSSLRQSVMQRVEREPVKEEPALVARVRSNWLRDRPDPLVLGAVVVVAVVVGLVLLPLLFHGGSSKKSSTAQNPTTVAAQPAAPAVSAVAGKATAAPATSSSPIFAAETPAATAAAARPAASPPVFGAPAAAGPQSGSAASPAGGLGPAARTVATSAATPAPGATPPLTRPARSAPLTPPSATPDPGQSLVGVVGNAAAAQPPAQVGSSSPGQVNIPGVTSSSSAGSGSSRAGVAPARVSGGGSAPVAAAAPQPSTIAPSLDDIAAQTQRAASAASSRGGH
ncbi:MAG TPA: hypothetical protein VKV26_10855 [Dehalococcoidia bacterium]|nr:hypothetical protein [Dehalococcoidia bacterium]